jgi:DNA-binding XRE family transcriptional regulator
LLLGLPVTRSRRVICGKQGRAFLSGISDSFWSGQTYRPRMLLGRELRRARHDADLTQEELAARAKMDRTYLSDLENDKFSPTVDMLERLCTALGVRASVLLARVEEAVTPADDDSASG